MGWPGPMTHRQFLLWQQFDLADYNRPSRTDHYLMQLACEVRRSWVRNKGSVTLDQFVLKFSDPSAPAPEPSREHLEYLSQQALAAWTGRLGGRMRIANPDGTVSDWIDTRSPEERRKEFAERVESGEGAVPLRPRKTKRRTG